MCSGMEDRCVSVKEDKRKNIAFLIECHNLKRIFHHTLESCELREKNLILRLSHVVPSDLNRIHCSES